MVKMQQETLTLEEAVQKFLMEKDAQHTGTAAMTDYRNCLARFVKSSNNSIEYDLLDADVLAFFSSIPDTSPARYNKPFQNVNAFLNWMVEQEYISKSPIKVHKLHKRKDEGNIKPVPVSDLKTFIASLDRRTYSEICGVKITPYQLRHSFATLFLKNGGDVFTLQHLMGHADLRMTRRYAELDEAFVEQQHKSFSPVVLLEQAKNNRVRRI